MGLSLVTAAASNALTLAEAKSHLRVDHSDDDALIVGYAAAAIEVAENFLNRDVPRKLTISR